MQKPLQLIGSCVTLGHARCNALMDMVDNERDITRQTFGRYVSLREVAEMFGYAHHPSQGLTLAGDWHVSYHRSKFAGVPCVYVKHSGIEYVYVEPDRANEALRESRYVRH